MRSLVLSLLMGTSIAHAQHEHSSLEARYQDRRGVEWSQTLKHKYTNGCHTTANFFGESRTLHCGPEPEVQESSNAFRICENLGWKLPGKKDWEYLAQELSHTPHPWGVSLTEEGEAHFRKLFGVDTDSQFTSKTLTKSEEALGNTFAFGFDISLRVERLKKLHSLELLSDDPGYFSVIPRDEKFPVICIRSPMF